MSYLFFDVDGTLVNSPKEWDISDSNKQALLQAKKAGHNPLYAIAHFLVSADFNGQKDCYRDRFSGCQ